MQTVLKTAGHVGTTNIRERAHAIGARLHIASSPGKGTRVVVDIDPVST